VLCAYLKRRKNFKSDAFKVFCGLLKASIGCIGLAKFEQIAKTKRNIESGAFNVSLVEHLINKFLKRLALQAFSKIYCISRERKVL